MDYEKKYKDRLEMARLWIEEGCSPQMRTLLESLFPELRESEDERIRRRLIQMVSDIAGRWPFEVYGITKKEAITYLEKQKEQNSEDEECTDFTIYHPLKNGKGKYECIPYSFYGSLTSFSEDKDLIDFLRTCFYTEEECEEWIKQKEQKPADEQFPPLEGLDAIKAKYYDRGFKNGFDEGVDSVKPAEWSGEDERMLTNIIERGSSRVSPYQTALREEQIEWLMNRLKSLRPSWKPSEEQMNYLCAAVDAAIRKHNESVSGYEPARVLKSLYEQLKKLM